jgi:ubiquinone/menaquinone biosynthesis C-methylase UbiE
LQNFHFQSGGWMTDDSAERYDTQVEVLLNGAANATRRQALPQLHEAFAGRDQRKLQLLDIGCGTGRFLDFVILVLKCDVRFTLESGHCRATV